MQLVRTGAINPLAAIFVIAVVLAVTASWCLWNADSAVLR